jgi:hypothetical protein
LSTIRLIYLIVFTLTFGTGLYVYKYHKALRLVILLLGLGLFTEYSVDINRDFFTTDYEDFIYNLYIPLEYFFYAAFFYYINTGAFIRKTILISVPIFILYILLLSEFTPAPKTSLSTNIYTFSGVLIVIWSLWTLFILKPSNNIKFIVHPLFWICTALIVFYSGNIPFNLMFQHLSEVDQENYNLVNQLFRKGLNIIFFTFFIIGFICSHQMKKY